MNFYRPKNFIDMIKIRLLYRSAFPKEERKPFSIILKMQKLGKTDLWYFTENGRFLGFVSTINGPDKVLIDYFTVNTSLRGQGNGTRMLQTLIEYYSPKGVFLEIEIPYENSENYEERVRRKAFYLRTGLNEIGTSVELFGVDMELLGVGVSMTYDEYRSFYLDNYSRYAYDHIKPVKNAEKSVQHEN